VSHMLVMAALQLCAPVAFVVEIKTGDGAHHFFK
jgi:hypothetical protein